ncbi:cytochrome bd-I oxidase subunit CydX [Candidatus Symbiobacter mobilis]|nr:cytochrome bd-I oxidase subunit CydX [Candidatus Symbiobacter mobilis]
MWYFAWVLGIAFAVLFAIVVAMWDEHRAAREATALEHPGSH